MLRCASDVGIETAKREEERDTRRRIGVQEKDSSTYEWDTGKGLQIYGRDARVGGDKRTWDA